MEHARQTTVITRREGATVPMKRGFPVEEFADIFDWSDLYPLRRSPDYGSRARRSMVTTPDNIRDQQSGDISGSPPRKGKSRIYSSQPPSSMEPRRQGMIPVNILGQRVDPPMPRLEDQAIERYHSIRPRPCNNMHLFGGCNDPDCTFDHNPIDEEVLGVMRMQLRFYSCKEKSACRKSGCLNSHMCQRCRGFDKKPGCRFPSSFHGMKTTVVDMVPAADLEVTEGGSNIAMPMPSSFADTERVDEAAAPREPGAGSEQDVVEQAVEVAVERGNAGQMNLLDFSDDE